MKNNKNTCKAKKNPHTHTFHCYRYPFMVHPHRIGESCKSVSVLEEKKVLAAKHINVENQLNKNNYSEEKRMRK